MTSLLKPGALNGQVQGDRLTIAAQIPLGSAMRVRPQFFCACQTPDSLQNHIISDAALDRLLKLAQQEQACQRNTAKLRYQ